MFDGSRSRGGREEVMKEEGEGSYEGVGAGRAAE
jgi:hypothetical protein